MIVAAAITLAAAGVSYAALRHTMPRGKGLFVRSVKHADSPAQMVERCKAMGIAWVAILYAWQQSDGTTDFYHLDEIPAYAAELRRAGIDVWLWAWPEPGRVLELARVYYRLAPTVRPSGLIINPEKPFYGKEHLAHAFQAMRDLRLTGAKIGVTTYGGGPVNHPDFPWQGFASADFGMPQFYDTHHRYSAAAVAGWIRSWRGAGFRNLFPIWGASNEHSPDEMRTEAAQTLEAARAEGTSIKAASWWDFYWLQQSSKRRGAVASISLSKLAEDGGAIA